jgi:AP-2 complex subunit beta-1
VPTHQTLDPSTTNATIATVANVSQGSLGVEESPTEYEPSSADPYSNLDGAFGNYVADKPRPMQDVRQSGIDDDLLF